MAPIPASIFIAPIHGALPSNPVAVLFHGLTGSPQELESLGMKLAGEGYRVLIPCLPGHGTTVEHLSQVPLSTFLDAGKSLFPHLGNRGSVVGGISFGSILALWCAQELPKKPVALVLLSPPFRLRSKSRERMLGLLSKFSESSLNKLGFSKKRERTLSRERHAYKLHSVAAATRLMQLRKQVLERLKQLTMPVLLLQDPFDHHVHPDGTERAVAEFGSEEVDTLWFPHGEHNLTLGPKEGEVLHAVRTFLRKVRSGNAA